MRPIVIFRFSETEGPAYFAQWLDRHALPWQLVAVDAGDALPSDPRTFAGIGMMGGPMSVNDALPWIDSLARFVRDAITEDIPVIGHCLGGQLLAHALGAGVRRTAVPEIGWIDVETTDAASQREWFGDRAHFTSFQWHFEVFDVPSGAIRILRNDFNPNQAFVIDDRHIGFQCHVEMTRDLVETWCRTGFQEIAPPSTPARQSREEILRDLPARLAQLQEVADAVYARWTRGLRHAA